MKVEAHYRPLGKGVENCKQYEKPIELYNLSTDEGEQNNMAFKDPNKVNEIKNLFKNSRIEHPEFSLIKGNQ